MARCSPKLVNMVVTPLAREVKHLRAERALTVRDVASRLRKSVAYIGKIEAGGEIPPPAFIVGLAEVLGAESGILLTLAKESLLARLSKRVERTYSLVESTTTQSGVPE